MKKIVAISTLLGVVVGIISFCFGYKFGEEASKNMIKESAYIKNMERNY